MTESGVIDKSNSECAARRHLFFKEGGLTVRDLREEDERIQAYRLRHRIFCEELKWVPLAEDALERDQYDENAVFLGVFDATNNLVAFLRLITAENLYMVENTFPFLVDPVHRIRKERDTAEVSRLCIAPETRNSRIRGNFGLHGISMLLYKGTYQWCMKNHIRYLYFVLEEKIFRLLRTKGFPCEAVGETGIMSGGIRTVAAIMDWKEFEKKNAKRRAALVEWFTR